MTIYFIKPLKWRDVTLVQVTLVACDIQSINAYCHTITGPGYTWSGGTYYK